MLGGDKRFSFHTDMFIVKSLFKLPEFICPFAMSDKGLFDFYSNTKLSESSDMTKS